MDNDTRKRKTALVLALLLIGSAVLSLAGCVGCAGPGSAGPGRDGNGGTTKPDRTELPEELAVSANEPMTADMLRTDTDPNLRALVLYADPKPGSETDAKKVYDPADGWNAAYTQLSQSLLVNLATEAMGVYELARSAGGPVFSNTRKTLADALREALAGYDLVYLEPDVTADETLFRNAEPALKDWVKDGGFLFVANASIPAFDKQFLGIDNYKKLNSFPDEWTLPEVRENLSGLQTVLDDYLTLFKAYRNAKDYRNCDFGFVVTPLTAVPLVGLDGGTALSAVNRWGRGFVCIAGGLLPNDFTVSSYTLRDETAGRETFIPTTAAASAILRSEFAAFASKERYGYAVMRVFGSDGQPSIAWQLHYEEETGIANGSAVLFADLAERYGQIPSYTLVRNTYTWFRSAGTVSYILGQRDENGRLFFEPDPYENAYDSGTRFVDEGTGEYLTFDTLNSGSYFTPNPWDNSAACTVDVAVETTADGSLLFLFRKPDGTVYTSFGRGFRDGNYVVSTPVYLDPLRFDSATGYDTMTEPFVWMDAAENEIAHFIGTPYERPGVGEWSRTATVDLDGDGAGETIIGNRDGYLGVYSPYLEHMHDSVMKWRFDGRLGSSFGNAFGNTDLKFGEYACPAFADLNGDGIPDLIVGHREYGLAYPIDSPYFPEAKELAAQLDELKERGYYVGAHVKTTIAATPEQERTELELHKKALEAYGIDAASIGANHHTWITSNASLPQTFESEWAAGFLWDSGWKAANNSVSPENNAENALVVPFFLVDENGDETILLFNTSTVGYDGNGWSAYMAKYDLPVSVYYHCDLAYLDPEGTETFVKSIGAFAERNGYRWVSEDTLAKEIAAAYNTTVVSAALDGNALTLRLGAKQTDRPLYDPDIQSRASVRVEPAECFETLTVTVWPD